MIDIHESRPRGNGFTWSPFADEVIREIYPDGGIEACARLLVDRSREAIKTRARHLKVRRLRTSTKTAPTPDCNPAPAQDDAADHRVWMEVDRLIRGEAVGVLAPRLGV